MRGSLETTTGRTRAALAATALAFVAATAALAADTFRGAADVVLGDTVHAVFTASSSGPHRYAIFVASGAEFSAVVKADAGSTLVPTLRLTRPGGTVVDVGPATRKNRGGVGIVRFTAPYDGDYVLEVGDGRGVGGYTLSTRGVAKKFIGLFPGSPAGAADFDFYAPAGARVDALVAPRRSGPKIEITGLAAPDGSPLQVLSLQRGAAAAIMNVPLPQSGKYRLSWTNHGAAGDLRLTFRFALPSPTAGVQDFGVADGVSTGVIEKGDPALAARAGYVGSIVCGRCHTDLVKSWSATAHNSAVRSWNRAGLSNLTMANDADGNGADDFKDGLDLATTPAFAAYGSNAPKLSYVAGAAVPYQVKIGATTYTVDRTMGGNGLWVQRYLTHVGNSYRVLPFQYDENAKAYAPYSASDWYDGSQAPLAAAPKGRTFEAQCSGCHETGETLQADASSGDVQTGYVELNVGCEQCHGPGADHALQGDPRKIKNPRKLIDGTAAGAAAADAICGRCHTRGQSHDALPGSGATAEFGYRADRGVSQAGDVVTDFLTVTNDPADFWGHKTNPLPAVLGDTSLAAKSDGQQYPDLVGGEHGPSQGDAPVCFDCHDPHQRVNDHQIATSVNRGTFVATQADDNSLCLACHAGDEQFPGVTKADAALISTGSPPLSVARAVLDHMKDRGMPARDGTYDPTGTGVGQCTSCHMPMTPSVGATTPDAGGFASGDIHSHRFEIVWPNASVLYGVTNSCNACHPTVSTDPVSPIISQWANAPAAGVPFHGRTPPTSQDGHALNAATNPSNAGGVQCVKCHTSEGFARMQVRGENLPQSEIDVIASESVAQDRGITCDACHGRDGNGAFQTTETNPLRFPRETLCAQCHNAESVTFADFQTHGAIARHPQAEMFAGTAGAPPPGMAATSTTRHTIIPDQCVACHYDSFDGVQSHTFLPNVATCALCHPKLATFDRPSTGDWDGNGQIQGVQTEVKGLLDRLKTALLGDARVSFAGGYFDFSGATDHAMTGASDAQKRAVFNWYTVSDDKSYGVHNALRAVQLLQASYKELTGVDVPGATLR